MVDSSRIKDLTKEQRQLLEKKLEMANRRKILLSLQEGNPAARKPVYCLHGPLGSVGQYVNLVRYLDSNIPVYGVQSPAYVEIGETREGYERAAAYYLDVIKQAHSEYPSVLVAHSSGAVIAFEMAVQLQEKGEPTPLVLSIDEAAPYGPMEGAPVTLIDAKDTVHEIPAVMFFLAWGVSVLHGLPLTITQAGLEAATPEERVKMVLQWLITTGFFPGNSGPERWRSFALAFVAELSSLRSYKDKCTSLGPPVKSRGRLVMFRATDETHWPALNATDPPDVSELSNWDKFCTNKVELVSVPQTNHMTIMTEPQVSILAQNMRPYLDEATRRN